MAAKNYTEILALVNAGNQMGLSNTIKRDYGIPLDFTSVQPTYADAVIYAAENTKAYVGQPLSVGGKLYIINDVAAETKYVVGEKEYDNYLVEVGSATEGDGVTIDLEEGVLTLHGFESALTGYLPRKAEDGTLEWVPISAVVQGDGNKVTTLTSEDESVTIVKKTDTDASLVYDLSVEKYDDTDLQNRVKALEDNPYDDSDLTDRISALETAVGDDESGLVKGLADTKTDLKNLEDTVNAFLTGDGTEAALDSLKELIAYIDSHDDTDIAGILESIQVLENKVDTGDKTVSAYVTAAIDALKIGDYAKAADLTALADRVGVLEAKPFDTYATKTEVENVDKKFENYTNTSDLTNLLAGKADADKVVANETFEEFKTANTNAIAAARSGAVADVAEVGYALASEVANTYATKGALEGVDTVAQAAAAQAETNKTDIAGHLARIGVLETAKGDHETRISTAEGQITALLAEDQAINKTLGEHAGSIAALQGEDSRLAGLIGANTTEIGKKANAADVYTKGEADKVIEDAIKAIPAVDLDPYAKTEDVAKTYATIAALEGIYKAGEGEAEATGVLAEEIARAKAAEEKIAGDLALLIENPTEALDSVKELIEHVQAHGTAVEGIIGRLDGHDTAIAGLGDRVTALENKPDYVLPAATKDTLGGVKLSDEVGVNEAGQLEVKEVSTDKLVNGINELILNGGNASGAASN